MINYWPLLGILLVVAGFALRFNPLLVVAVAAIVTGLLGHMPFLKVLATLGHGFNENRYVTIIWIILPVVGLLERYGLQEQARALIGSIRGATAGRLLIVYLAIRQILSALGLTTVAGHPQTVRPLVAPMAVAAAEKQHGKLDEATSERVKAMSAATDNVGLFFGEDIFLAVASILLIQGSLASFGIQLAPFQLSAWAIPSAICAFLIHGTRLLLLDRELGRIQRVINLHWLYVLAGAVFAGFALGSARDETNPKRWGNAAFWGLLAFSFWFGDLLGDTGNGILALVTVAIAGLHLIGRGTKELTTKEERQRSSARYGNKLFLPALLIPFTAFVGTLLFNYTPLGGLNLIDPKAVTLVLLGCGVIIALIVSHAWLRPPALAAVDDGSRLMNGVGWAAVLPQMLASLGVIFAAAGVGTTIGAFVGAIIPHGSIFLAVLLFAFGMVIFTMIMGNAFAAFPVMAAAIGVPILIQQDGGNPAVVGAVGMLSGFCGTLMTPMAANFNIVPAALLELKDQNGVIKAQIPTAIPLLVANIVILYVAGFRL